MSKLESIKTFTLKEITDKVNDTYNLAEARIIMKNIDKILDSTTLSEADKLNFKTNLVELKNSLGGKGHQAKLNVILRNCRNSYYRPAQKLGYRHIFNRAMANQLAQKFMKFAVVDLVHRGYYHNGDNQLSIHTRLTHKQLSADLEFALNDMRGTDLEKAVNQARLKEAIEPLFHQKVFTYQTVMLILKRGGHVKWSVGLRLHYAKLLK